ncbi:30S ribosome-binding factor RbfA [Curvivirga aplysinae]|uniref:30S ribosome-binding factor RbfA n=1 Tax=Curvivirga aplysinae TaxID=2529852 RepID=UPI0012BD5CA4|nr:30S ribosome-binding factor RbfA [Curvivirga aplysinae]MTI09536.1 30S ribosome-binding factor RbfA [Curvivirga aplysinae]
MAHKNRSGVGRSQRQLKVGEEIRHALSSIIMRGEFRNPILQKANLTVTEVRASPDLRNATCFIVPLGGEDRVPRDQVLEALRGAAVYLKTQVSQSVHLKYAPRLSFQYDESFDEGSHVDALLRNPVVQADVAKGHDEDDFED